MFVTEEKNFSPSFSPHMSSILAENLAKDASFSSLLRQFDQKLPCKNPV